IQANTTDNSTQSPYNLSLLEPGTYIILGGPFLRYYYTLFDADNQTISFGVPIRFQTSAITVFEVIYVVFGAFIILMFAVFVISLVRIWTTKKQSATEKLSLEKPILEKPGVSNQFIRTFDNN